MLLVLLALAGPAQTAPTEAQPKSQAPSALTKPSAPACAPPCLTAEQEAALVEVRKILKEARQVAEGITIPEKGMLRRESELKILRDEKAELIRKIEQTQFRAGDFSTAATTMQPWTLAFAQAKYGNVQEAVKAADQYKLADDTLLFLVNALIQDGAMQAAITVTQTEVARKDVPGWRQRKEATVFAFIAQRQYEAGDPAARATLQRALQTALAIKNLEDKYLALIHVARAQAVMGDRTASAETFRQAIQALLDIEGGKNAGGLWRIAKVQAEVGDVAASEQTFQQAIQLSLNRTSSLNVNLLGCIAWAQAVSGQRGAAMQTFQLVLRGAESLPPEKRVEVLIEIGKWQRKVGEGEAVAETIQRALESARAVADAKARTDALTSVAAFATRSRYFKKAMEIAEGFATPESQIGHRQLIARILIETKDPFGTPELFSKLAQEASEIAKSPLPQDKFLSSRMLEDLARVQAAAGQIPEVQSRLGAISDENILGGYAYPRVVQLLTRQGNLLGARQVATGLKEKWILWGGSDANNKDALRELARLGVRVGDIQGTLSWTRKQSGGYAQGYALLGVADELMERKGIEDPEKVVLKIRSRENCPSSLELMN